MNRTLKVNHKLLPFHTKPQQIKVAIGGRGSGKSIGIGDLLTFKMDTEDADIYCLREFQDSITDSVHRVFADSVNKRLMLEGWDIQQSRVIAPNGATTTYKGANRNPDSMQSAQGYKYSWVEEAHRLSQASIDKLLPTILRNPGAECWFTANPQSSGDPFSQRFIIPYLKEIETNGYYEDDLHYIVMVNWRDNPWWNKEQETLRQWDFENLSRAKYDWIWEGKFMDTVEDAIIQPEWFDAAIDAHKLERLERVFRPFGAKVAAHDPSGQGSDSKGYALRHGSIIRKVKEKLDGDVDDGFDWAADSAIEDGADMFVWDGDGMGAGAKRQVSLAFKGKHTDFHMFRGSLSGSGQDNATKIYMPVDEDKSENGRKPKTYAETFKNNRAQYYTELATRFYNTYKCVKKGDYVDPDLMISLDSEGIDNLAGLRSELCRIPMVPNGSGLIQIMNKKEMKTNGIESPNQGDSVMMCLFKPKPAEVMEPLDYPEMSIV
jgi:phage terminase large subunit